MFLIPVINFYEKLALFPLAVKCFIRYFTPGVNISGKLKPETHGRGGRFNADGREGGGRRLKPANPVYIEK